MKTFKTLAEVVAYIMDAENPDSLRWNNDAGDWDIEDIKCNADMYDEKCSEYVVDVETYDIYDDNYKGGECLFRRIEDAPSLSYEVYEDNGGGLSMFVLNGENPIWGHSGYEFAPENLREDIAALDGADFEDVPNWDGNGVFSGRAFVAWEDTPAGGLQSAYLEISQGSELVADGSGVYPDRMGAAGREAFGA